MNSVTGRTLDQLIFDNLIAYDDDTQIIRKNLQKAASHKFCIKPLPEETAYDDAIPEKLHFVQLNSTDLANFEVASSTTVGAADLKLKTILENWPKTLTDFQETLNTERPSAPGHYRTGTRTRLDMELGLKSGFCIIILWNESSLVRFGSPRYDARNQEGHLSGEWAPLALTQKQDNTTCALKRPRYLDDRGQGLITVCEYEKNFSLDFNVLLDITDEGIANYQTPIIIDPSVKNDG